MGRKKKRPPPSPYSRIFCYYCDRNFSDEQTLLSHQREKHLRCPTCYKRMLSVPSMTIHAAQMHNVTLTAVPNAIPSRSNISIDVLGMKGIPDSYYASLTQQQDTQTPSKLPRNASNPNPSHFQHNRNTPAQPNHPQHQHYQQPYHGYASSSYVNPHQYPHHQPPHYPAYQMPYPQQPTHPTSQHPPLNRQHPTLQANTSSSLRHSLPPYTYSRPHPSAPVLHPPQPHRPAATIPTATRTLTNSHQPRPATTASQNLSKQAYGPVKPTKHTPIISAPTSSPSSQLRLQDAEQRPASVSAPKAPPPEIKVIFDRLDISMEELRAQLPRYKVV